MVLYLHWVLVTIKCFFKAFSRGIFAVFEKSGDLMNLSILDLYIFLSIFFTNVEQHRYWLFFQIRGFLSRYHLVLPASLAFDKCIACSSKVRLTLPALLLLQTDLSCTRRGWEGGRGKSDVSLLSLIPIPVIPLNKTRLHRFVTMASMVVVSTLIQPCLMLILLLVFRALS